MLYSKGTSTSKKLGILGYESSMAFRRHQTLRKHLPRLLQFFNYILPLRGVCFCFQDSRSYPGNNIVKIYIYFFLAALHVQ